MSDVVNQGQTPAEEDPVLHGLLASLPQPAPTRTLEDHVLSGVFRPHPRWFRRIRAAWTDLNESGRIWLVVGGLAAGSIIPLAAFAIVTVTLVPHVGSAVSFTATEILPHARAGFSALTASLLETLNGPIEALALSGPAWVGIAAGALAACAGCSWGLYRTMTPRAARK